MYCLLTTNIYTQTTGINIHICSIPSAITSWLILIKNILGKKLDVEIINNKILGYKQHAHISYHCQVSLISIETKKETYHKTADRNCNQYESVYSTYDPTS